MIHESGNTLLDKDRASLKAQAATEEDRILSLMRVRRFESFTAWQMAGIYYDIAEGNCRRAMSNMAGSDSTRRDQFGNFPLIKREDIRRVNPRTGKSNVAYQYNDKYGKEPAVRTGQLSLLEESVYGI